MRSSRYCAMHRVALHRKCKRDFQNYRATINGHTFMFPYGRSVRMFICFSHSTMSGPFYSKPLDEAAAATTASSITKIAKERRRRRNENELCLKIDAHNHSLPNRFINLPTYFVVFVILVYVFFFIFIYVQVSERACERCNMMCCLL